MVYKSLLTMLCIAYSVTAAPAITKAVNTAGYLSNGLPNGGLAQGSYIAIFGSGLGPAVPATGIAISGYPLQKSFQGVSAKIGSTDLLIVYATPTQVGAIVPSGTPVSASAPLTLTYNGSASPALNVKVVAHAFGTFSLNQAGMGPVVGLKYISQASQPPSTMLEPVYPGSTVTLFGTGLGAGMTPDDQIATDTSIPGLSASDIEVTVGGKKADVSFFGRSTCCSSIDQINIVIPNDAPKGCYVPVSIKVKGVLANATSVSVSDQGEEVCSDPNGYTKQQLLSIKARGEARIGYVGFTKAAVSLPVSIPGIPGLGDTVNDSVFANFDRYPAHDFVRSMGTSTSSITIGQCNVFTFEGQNGSAADPIEPEGLRAGTLSVTNSNGTKGLTTVLDEPGTYYWNSNPLTGDPEYLTTGIHTVKGTGGDGVGAFTTSIDWKAPFVWSNKGAISAINRSAPLTVNWSGGNPDGFVGISGWSATNVGGENYAGAGFYCVAEAGLGTFTIPTSVLSALPPSSKISAGGGISYDLGNLSVSGVSKPVDFTTAAPTLDIAITTYQHSVAKTLPVN